MNELTRDAGIIAAEINAIKTQVKATVISGAVEIGKRLAEAKEMVPHGEWGGWLETHVDYSERTAQNLMRCWEEYGKTGRVAMLEDVSLSNAITLLGVDPEHRRALIESGEASEMSNRDLKERIAQMEAEDAKKQVRIDELLGEIEGAEKTRADAIEAMSAAQAAVESKAAIEERLRDAMNAATAARQDAETLRRKARENEENAVKKALLDAEAKAHAEKVRLQNEADELRTQIDEANARANAAEERAKAAESKEPEKIEVTAYAVPPEVEAELTKLREIAAKAPSEAIIKLRDSYNRAVAEFQTLKGLLGDLGEDDAAKYRAAMAAGLRKMANAIGEEG